MRQLICLHEHHRRATVCTWYAGLSHKLPGFPLGANNNFTAITVWLKLDGESILKS